MYRILTYDSEEKVEMFSTYFTINKSSKIDDGVYYKLDDKYKLHFCWY